MPSITPPQIAIDEFLSPITRHTRRIEIYEADGITRWSGDTVNRLKGGQVSIDYTRDERRSLDLTLTNYDRKMDTGPGNLWYDKIIKVFRGVNIGQHDYQPKIFIIGDIASGSSASGYLSLMFRQMLATLGYTDVTIDSTVTTYSQISDYDIIVGLGTGTTAARALMVTAFNTGKTVFVMGADAASFVPAVNVGATSVAFTATTLTPIATSTHPTSKGWTSFANSTTNSKAWTHTYGFSNTVSFPSDQPAKPAIMAWDEPTYSGRAVIVSTDLTYTMSNATDFMTFLRAMMLWLDKYVDIQTWETQIGEFMIDRIVDSSFPYEIKITGRDYTKKCMLSKFTAATQFSTGLSLESIIGNIASNAGIVKRNLPSTGVVVNKSFYYERGTPRWDAMKEIAQSYSFDIYFDQFGYLVLQPFNDPSLTSPTIVLHTGPDGQLASWEKTTTDSRLYNHILVTGESSDGTVPPVYGEAKNTSATSNTSIARIGDRLYQYTSSFIYTTLQAQTVADNFLAVHTLEEFEINFESLMLPWLEGGDIIGFDEGVDVGDDPTTFLLSSITLPLELAPMSTTGKRVTIVNT